MGSNYNALPSDYIAVSPICTSAMDFTFLYIALAAIDLTPLLISILIVLSPLPFSCHVQIMLRRKDLKIVVMSATLDALKFQQYFENAPLMKVSSAHSPSH